MLLLSRAPAFVELRRLLFVELPEKAGVSYPLYGEERAREGYMVTGEWSTIRAFLWLARMGQ